MKNYYLIIIGIVFITAIGNDENDESVVLHNKLSNVKNEYKGTSQLNIGMSIGTIAGGLTTAAGIYFESPGATIIGTITTTILGSAGLIFNCISCCQNHDNSYNDDDL